MSQEKVEIVRAYYDDIDRTLKAHWANPGVGLSESAGTKAIIERLHPEVVWKPPFRSADEGYRGPEGIRRALDELVEAIEEWRITVEGVVDGAEDRVLLTSSSYVRGKGSGVAVHQRVFTVVTFRDGKMAEMEDFTDRNEALEAAGLRE
jgi:ketosteroid isomerase-like protein